MKVSELLSDRSKWTQEVCARDKHGDPIDFHDPLACKWCLLGAVYRCYSIEGGQGAVLGKLQSTINKHYRGRLSIPSINDNFGYEVVMEIVREADV